jgi:hypothetical protein
LAVPALNVRSGPGLQYDIIGKVRTTGAEAATVNVNGRSADGQWLTVTPDIADKGWITSSPSFITCGGDVTTLPLVEAPPAPTPEPVAQAPEVQPAPQPAAPADPAATVAPEAPPAEALPTEAAPAEPAAGQAPSDTLPPAPGIPPGQALLIVNNGFQYDIRFTVDQHYRPTEGPSEYDLAPGQAVNIVVYPGQIAFTASSPWNGLSGNAELHLDSDQSATLWLRFEPDGDNSGEWKLVWQ